MDTDWEREATSRHGIDVGIYGSELLTRNWDNQTHQQTDKDFFWSSVDQDATD